MTRTAHSTSYRILRTLVDRGYVSQDIDGRFGVKDSGNARIVWILEGDRWSSLHRTRESEETLVYPINLFEILLAILQNLRLTISYADLPVHPDFTC